MLGTMPLRTGSVTDMKATIRVYEDDLRDLPQDMVAQAIRDFRSGKVGGGRFAPTIAEIGQVVRDRIEAVEGPKRRAEAQQKLIDETLAARGRRSEQSAERTDDSRARVAGLAEDCKNRIERINANGRKLHTGDDWDALTKEITVDRFSDELISQFMGEKPIGEGNLGLCPVVSMESEAAE